MTQESTTSYSKRREMLDGIKRLAFGALFLSPLVAAGLGFQYGKHQEQENNRDAQAQATALQRCELALGELAGKTIDERTIDHEIYDSCNIPKPSESTVRAANEQEVATISTTRYFVDLPSRDALNHAQDQLRADAQDSNPVILLQYAGISFSIAAGYVTMMTVSRNSMQ